MKNEIVLRHSFANPMWWGWHRFIYWEHHRRMKPAQQEETDMDDTTAGGMPWMQPQPPSPETAPARPARQKRQPRAAAEPKAPRKPRAPKPPAEAAPTPKPRKAKAERAAPETIKVSLKDFAHMRVGPDDAKLFLKLHSLLSLVSKSTRAKVLGELTKVLA